MRAPCRWATGVAAGTAVTLFMVGCSPSVAPTTPPPTSPAPSPGTSTTRAGVPGVSPDFDGDGGADLVVGIGSSPARVSVRYANGGTLDFGRKDVDTANPDSVDFGQALLARDLNDDGYTDLIVSDPGDGSSVSLFWIFGSAAGLDLSGRTLVTTDMSPGAGHALALLTTPRPTLVVAGGEGSILTWALGADGRASSDPAELTPDALGLPDLAPGSRFGSSLAAQGSLLVVGAPGEKVGAATRAGAIYTVDFSGEPLRATRITQDWPGVPDNAEPGDRFGASLAIGDGWLAVGVPGEGRKDEQGHNQPGTGMVQLFAVSGTDLRPEDAIDQNYLPGKAEAGDGFGFSVAIARPCTDTAGVLVGAPAEAIGSTQQAGSVWLVPVGDDVRCGPIQLYDGAGLGAKAGANTVVGSAVSALRVSADGDTLVVAAQGNSEEGVPGRVLTLDHPYTDAPFEALSNLRIAEERAIALTSAG